ncbi:MAG: signal peptidase I [Candidatus Nanoarchaeia archaeon]
MKKEEKKKKKTGNYLKQFWNFVWNDDSVWSWIVSIILAFIIIRFIFYPLLGLALGTNLPVVAVISSSMEHRGEDWTQNPAYCYNQVYCLQEEWYLEKGITPSEFEEFSFKNGFNKGDIMIIVGKKTEKIEVGDTIVFEAGKNYPIIHRVVAIHNTTNGIVFETKGDNNPAQIANKDLNEKNITADKIKGVAKVRIPFLGYIKIGAANAVMGIRNIFS